MQIKKEEVAGKMYLGYQYSAGLLRRHTPKQRAGRKKTTAEGKKIINALRRKTVLMMLMAANFVSGRDLFVELGYSEEPDAKRVANALKTLHRNMRKICAAAGLEYKYILITETHGRDGQPVRLHHHIIMTGAGGLMLDAIKTAWGMGGVDVRTLRELADNFEDTCEYLLKEDKPKGKRAYSTSANLTRPPEPLRRKVPEGEAGEIPPGVKVVRHKLYGDEYGRYEIIMGKIIDQRAFDGYWARAQRDRRRIEEERNRRKYRRQKQQRDKKKRME